MRSITVTCAAFVSATLATAALSACTQPNAPDGNQTAAAMPDTSARDATTAPDAGNTGLVQSAPDAATPH